MSNSLEPDQAQRNVGPDLGLNCLQKYQKTTLVCKEFMNENVKLTHCVSSPLEAISVHTRTSHSPS